MEILKLNQISARISEKQSDNVKNRSNFDQKKLNFTMNASFGFELKVKMVISGF
jgi:hypothetical protein